MALSLILAPFSDRQLAELRKSMAVTYESWLETGRLWDPEELGTRLRDESISILVIESDFVFQEVFDRADQLRFVGVCRSTTSHVDVENATRHGVLVVNTPGRNAQAVAEHVLGLMLSLARRIPEAHRYVIGERWINPAEPYISMRGVELAGRTLGIIGLGAIGRKTATLASTIGMTTIAYDPFVADAPEDVEMTGLDELLSRSDFVTIHAPLSEDTEGILDARRLALLKHTACLVNTSDAALVDQDALVEALHQKRIAGAALDVFDSHPISPGNPLLSLDNVVLTPHLGGATAETIERHSQMMAADIQRFLAGQRPENLVNPEAWKRHG